MRREHPGRRKLDGVLLLDKPVGLSSSTALQHAKRLLAAEKAGHGGTLDPLASGLLPLLFGEATKFAQYGLDADKAYTAEVRLGVTTDTCDAEGQVLETREVRCPGDLEPVLEKFRGPIQQIPPMFSALKRDGRPLYELARAGQTVERQPRQVVIHELALLAREGDVLRLQVRCSKGTYIRQLAADLGAALGCGAHLAALRRTGVGPFTLERAVTLDALQAAPAAERDAWLLPADLLLQGLPRVELDVGQAERFLQGQALRFPSAPLGACRVYRSPATLLGVGEGAAGGELHPVRLLALQEAEKARKTL